MPKNLLLTVLNDTAKDLTPTFFFVLALYFYVGESNWEFALASLAAGVLLGFAKYLSRRLACPVVTSGTHTEGLDSAKKKNYS